LEIMLMSDLQSEEVIVLCFLWLLVLITHVPVAWYFFDVLPQSQIKFIFGCAPRQALVR